MEIEYQQTKKDYTDFYKQYYNNALKKRAIVIIGLLLIAISYFGKQPFKWSLFLIGTIASAVVIFSIYYLIPLLNSLIVLNKVLAKEPAALEKKKLTVVDEGLLIESESATKTWNWATIASANMLGNFVYLILADKRMLLLPKRHFQSNVGAINFLVFAQGKIGSLKQPMKPVFRDKRKNPSLPWFIACLVPIIGAVTGVILLADGASRYKEKWYILLGFGGILFTVTYAIILVGPINKGLAEQWIPFAQMDVNTLMKDVEFYKMSHGAYPDNLKQLKKDDEMAPIYDAIVSVQFTNNKTVEYNYKRVGNHYYLFSSGPDGKKGTADDIYPQVSKADSGKFGLIIPK